MGMCILIYLNHILDTKTKESNIGCQHNSIPIILFGIYWLLL